MNRYLLTFYKKDNMRFISHLDLQTLFQRVIKRGNVKVAYSNGFNPHELINIVQPLSLGYESEGELVEIDTEIPYAPKDLMDALNLGLPQGIKFIACEERERKNKQTSCPTKYAEYRVKHIIPGTIEKLKIKEYLSQDKLIILKHDKKTGGFIEKDVKELVEKIELSGNELLLKVACASNKTVNPSNLLKSLFDYSQIEYKQEELRITRTYIVLE